MTIWKYEGLILMQMLYKFKIYELDIYIAAGQIYSGQLVEDILLLSGRSGIYGRTQQGKITELGQDNGTD